MKIKIDENLPQALARILNNLGHEAHTVVQEGLAGRDDQAVWVAAQQEERLLLTQDMDFSDLRRFAPGSHAGIVLLRLNQPSRKRFRRRIEEVFQTENVELWARCVVVISDRRVRVRKPSNS